MREVIGLIAAETGLPAPWFSVPTWAGYAFGWLMERLHPLIPGGSPFLTRSIVHLAEDWVCSTTYARDKLGDQPSKDWRVALREALVEIKARNYPWPPLAQAA